MKLMACLIISLLVTGCATTRSNVVDVSDPLSSSFNNCTRDHLGGEDCITRVRSEIPGGAYGAYGGGLAFQSHLPAAFPIGATVVENTTEGGRAMERIPVPLAARVKDAPAPAAPATGSAAPATGPTAAATKEDLEDILDVVTTLKSDVEEMKQKTATANPAPAEKK
jgi:hypothetical protein